MSSLPAALLQLLFAASFVVGRRVDFGYVPLGHSPTLYDAATEPIVQLDDVSFDDTVYRADTAFLVEFYADWCGHCRAFAPYFKDFAELVRSWTPVVKVAVINCADPFNDRTCDDNDIFSYPTVKYFRRSSSSAREGVPVEAVHSGIGLRSVLMAQVVTEYTLARHGDWPNFAYLTEARTYGELWAGTPESVEYLAVVFQETEESSVGAQLILDLSKQRRRMAVRRAVHSTSLANILRIRDYPAVVVFRRDEKKLVHSARYDHETLGKLERIATESEAIDPLAFTTTLLPTTTTSAAPSVCLRDPTSPQCKERYFVSETDMLKAMRYALLNEVSRAGDYVLGSNLTALKTFVGLLANHFPTRQAKALRGRRGWSTSNLQQSTRAKNVFVELSAFLSPLTAADRISTDEWERVFTEAERRHSFPFAEGSDWQHCRGSSPLHRGYTCGLWTTFHAVTVQAYRSQMHNTSFRALSVLRAIQGWVNNFFGCKECRDHFMTMTEKSFPMKKHVRKAQDVVMYLWQAHNTVNARLRGDSTEDPEFPKFQFPTEFQCSTCSSQIGFHRRDVRSFLMTYYAAIKPHARLAHKRIRI